MTSNRAEQWVVQSIDGVTYVDLPAESMTRHPEMERVCAAIMGVIDQGERPQVVIRFGRVKHLPSAFLGKLIAFNKRVQAKGGRLALTKVSDDLREVLKITGITKLIPIIEPGQRRAGSWAGATVAWAAALAVTSAGAVLGAYLLLRLVTDGWPQRGLVFGDRMAAGAILYFILMIPLALACWAARRIYVQVGRDMQWTVEAVITALSLVAFWVLVMAG